jgi:hypothetical protein
MKYLKLLILSLIVALLFGCEKEKIYPEGTITWAPSLIVKRNNNSIELHLSIPEFINNKSAIYPWVIYTDPDYFEVFISDSGLENWEHYGTFKYPLSKSPIIIVDKLTAGKTYYFKVRSIAGKNLENESDPVMFISGPPKLTSSEIEKILEDRNSHKYSFDKNFYSYHRFYSWNENNGETSVFIQNSKTSVEKLVEINSFNPAWSPVENLIAYRSDNVIIQVGNKNYRPALISLYNPSSDTIIRLTENKFSTDLSWSHDGKWIIFISDFQDGKEFNIWKVNVSTKQKYLIAGDIGGLENMGIIDDRSARNPIFSMDGSQISFQRRTNNSRYHPFNLFTVPSSGGVIRELTNSYWDDTYPDFSKNGEFISFISNRTGENQVWCLNLNSKLLFQITDN